MAIKDWPGGVVSDEPVVPAGPYQDGAASGVWHLSQVADYVEQGIWPTAGNLSPRGVFGGGTNSGVTYNIIDYVSIASTGNAADFGDMTQATSALAGTASETRGIFGGGYDSASSRTNVISYITIESTGNASDFGDLTVARNSLASSGSATRAIFAGGEN